MTKVLNGNVKPGDIVTYTTRKYWDMKTSIGVVVHATPTQVLVRVVKSSAEHVGTRLVWLTELHRVVKVGTVGE